jgi:hypothetical protein
MKRLAFLCVASLMWCALFGQTVSEDYKAARQEALLGDPTELCGMYLSNYIPKDQEYMYWMIYQYKLHEEWFPAKYALGEAYVEGIPSIKVEQNFTKALYYFQYYAMVRPAIDPAEMPDGYWWFENGAVLHKLRGLWDKGYQPCVTNEYPASLSIVDGGTKLTSGTNVIKTSSKTFLSLQIENTGKGDADFPLVVVTTADKNITIPTVSTPLIRPSERKTVVVPITVSASAKAGSATLNIEVRDPGTLTSIFSTYRVSIQ